MGRLSIGKTKKCAHPRCLAQIPTQQWACGEHWRMLPIDLRGRINQAYDHRARTGDARWHHATLNAAEHYWVSVMQ